MDPTPPKQSVNSLMIGLPTGIVIFIMIIVLFQFKDSMENFQIILWGAVLVIPYIIAVSLHFITQYVTCRKIDSGKAFLGGVATFVSMIVGMGISSMAWFRIPVASVFAPLILEDTEVTLSAVKNSSATCPTKKRTLIDAEAQYPILSGVSYGFYLFFATMFGMVIGTSVSVTC